MKNNVEIILTGVMGLLPIIQIFFEIWTDILSIGDAKFLSAVPFSFFL